ncbi:MAG: GGDEF domain-containing response regulator [Wenzhouxiangella sp.]
MDTQPNNETKQRPRILFIDDSRVMRVCAQRMLGDEFEVVACETADSAWELLAHDCSFRLIFTDLQMPGRSGFDLLNEIRSSDSPTLAELPVVVLTGSEDLEEKRRQALDLGATDFLSKPFSAPELIARARAYSDSLASRRRLRLLEDSHHLDLATGLGNRGYCEQRLAQAMSFTRRHGQALTLLHLRLSGLERLIEDMGSEWGAQVLQRLGEALAARVRHEDAVFRSGPECFSFLLPATLPAGADVLQQRVQAELDALGLCGPGDGLPLSVRFFVQPVLLDSAVDAAALLAGGLAGRLGPNPASADLGVSELEALDLEEALRLLERGELDRLRPHLGHLRQRLQPLLAMLG